jgi:MinD-like ATPase involved in chromosome partitioning or flagellar assembly
VECLGNALEESDIDADTVVLDLGNSPNRATCRLWQAADAAFIVATAETAGIIGAYDAIKILSDHGAVAPPTFVVVNMAASPDAAEAAYRRLARAAYRFLGLQLASAECHLTTKKEKTNLNFHAPTADTRRELPAADRLLNWTKRVKSTGTRETDLWPDSMQESSAC